MSIIVAQVSDLHIKGPASKGALRISALAGALGSLREHSDSILILLTGDIAFSGAKQQYDVALEKLSALKEKLLADWGFSDIRITACPGNHDLDFSKQSGTIRDALIGSLDSSQDKREIAQTLAQAQADFDDFSRGLDIEFADASPIAKYSLVQMGGMSFNLICANTSWSSRIKEDPGSVRMPASLLPHMELSESLTLALLHHPLNWYDPQDAKALSDWLDANSDIAFWGHEHREDSFKVTRKRLGSSVQHYLARPMEDETVECGFRCLVINNDVRGLEASFSLRGDRFVLAGRDEIEIRKNPARQLGQIRFGASFNSFLADLGGVFRHPRIERSLLLQDIFIEPSFRPFSSRAPELEKVDRSLSFSKILDEIKNQQSTVIFGIEQAGKTTFAKYLLEDARHHGLTPLYFDGARLKSSNNGDVTAWIRGSIEHQYEADCIDLVSQVAPPSALVVIDNMHEIPGSPAVVSGIIDRLRLLATRCVQLTAQNPAVTILAASQSSTSDVKLWSDSKWYELMPLNNKSRAALIRRWVSVGRDEFVESDLIESETRRVKALLDKSMGSSISIKYPFFLLVILQQIDASQDANTVIRNGTQGYIFEAMISSAIDLNVKSHDVGVVHDFLANLAFNLRGADNQVVGEDGFRVLLAEFKRDMLVQLSHPGLLNELIGSKILQINSSGVSFRYAQFYYYYLARWIAFNREGGAAEDLLDQFVGSIHSESSANIVTFVAHFGHEKWVLSKLIPAAKLLFSQSPECRLADHGAVAEKYNSKLRGVVLLDGSASQITDHFSETEDQVDVPLGEGELEDAFKYMTAARTIQVLGQIMRSRAGGVGAHEKREIAKTAISLARRLMSVLYGVVELSAGAIIENASELFDSDIKSDSREARHQASLLLAAVIGGIAKGVVGRAADVVATKDLVPLIDSIEEDAISTSDRDLELMMLCARVSAEQVYPQERVNRFLKKISNGDVLSHDALAHCVARMFYLSPPPRAVRDSACSRLGIRVRNIPTSGGMVKR
ncbi:metallophosphoesterase [Stenotrophomonas geniculata]|uniref:metallophosphoesterase n=1 Tax=Stenotrophomonas geniculata TaxID=86188 RepID=UPI002E79687C|nr:metallophosphoesterase [Stenotrophomonas geniculata]